VATSERSKNNDREATSHSLLVDAVGCCARAASHNALAEGARYQPCAAPAPMDAPAVMDRTRWYPARPHRRAHLAPNERGVRISNFEFPQFPVTHPSGSSSTDGRGDLFPVPLPLGGRAPPSPFLLPHFSFLISHFSFSPPDEQRISHLAPRISPPSPVTHRHAMRPR
jgi:hypothetical protein